jgi:hypothetical protein
VKWPGRLSFRARSSLLLALFLVVAFGPLVAPVTSQPGSRLALTAALAEHGTVDIRGYPLGIDRATYNGHLRSDKAPGQPVLAVPAYLAADAVGAQSAAHLRQVGNLTAWWVTFWTAFVPFVALVVLMYLVASRYSKPGPAIGAAVGLGVCTMMLPHAVNLYGATLAAFAAYAAWAILSRRSPSNGQLLVAGALAGASVAAEYETAIVFAVLAVVAARQVRGRVAWFVLGAAGPALAVAWYQTAAFGRPWRTAHEYYATPAIRREIVGYARPGWRGIDATFFGSHGLLFTNVIVLVGLAAALMLIRSPNGDIRRHALVAVVIAVPYLALCVVWKGTPALEEPGPRYMIPVLPFLAVPLASAWPRWRRVAVVAMGVSGVVAVGAATTNILTGKQEQVLPAMVDRLAHREFLPTIWSIAFGRVGILVYIATLALAVVAVARLVTREPERRSAAVEP